MDELSIDELNKQIKELDFWKLHHYAYLPSIDSLEVVIPDNICNMDERQEVRKRIIGKQIPLDYDISEDSYLTHCVCKFILDKKTPPEEKAIVCEYLNEKLKKIIFELFIEIELKNRFKPDIDDVSDNIYYSPKVNGVPLKMYRYDDKGVMQSYKIDVKFKEIEDFFAQKIDNPNSGLLLCVKHLLNESNVVNEKWCPEHIKNLINNLNNNTWERKRIKLSFLFASSRRRK